jgi:uncharacterized membrane protein
MKKFFFAGLITLLPVIVTYIIILFGIHIISTPFERMVHVLLVHLGLFQDGLGVFTQDQVIHFISVVSVVIFLACFTFLVGFFTRKVLFRSIGDSIENIISKIPIINRLYHPLKELVEIFFQPQSMSSRQAVLVPYPTPQQLSVALVTGEFMFSPTPTDPPEPYISVFVLSTPNATNGYLCAFRKEEVEPFELPADEALKYVMQFACDKRIK